MSKTFKNKKRQEYEKHYFRSTRHQNIYKGLLEDLFHQNKDPHWERERNGIPEVGYSR